MSVRTLIVSASAAVAVGAAAACVGGAMGFAARGAVRAPGADGSGGTRQATGCRVLQPGASPIAKRAVAAACGQVGVWYSRGGGHGRLPGATFGHYDGHEPASRNDAGRMGFDSSGLVRYAYFQATGVDILNGTADDQFRTTHAVARFTPAQGIAPLLPGDLLFWGLRHKHHVAIYLGGGRMVEAWQSGTRVWVSPVRLGGDYAGAVRIDGPAAATSPAGTPRRVRTSANAPGYHAPAASIRRAR